ncbi:MAG TPA: MFS transporter [Solirubrobacteraceae bacterium]|jgi:EmrB/QacA subfamily drug resistance transporter
MSTTITIRRPGKLAGIARRQPKRSAQRSGSARTQLAEQAYAAELAHAGRARPSRQTAARSVPARERGLVAAVRAMRATAARPGSATGSAPVVAAEPPSHRDRRRWLALAVLCLGQLMMVLDATIVNVALPSIQHDLHFTQSNLTWVMNGYLITFGGFLLLAGRLGDLVGRKKVFLTGLVLFVAASIFCGIASSQGLLIVARLLQGAGGAVASSVILAIIVTEFPGKVEQAKAMGMYAFVSAGGGSIGLLAGGALTQSLDWHWIFFVNVPIGIVAFVLGSVLVEENEGIGLAGGIDWLGSILITLATVAGAFAIVKSSEYGLLSARTLGVGGAAIVLLGAFLALEARLRNPIMPLRVLRLRMLMGSSLVRGLLVTGMFSSFFLGSLYLERVLGYDAIETGLAFMPLTIAIATMSMGVSSRAVQRFGAVRTLTGGLGAIILGLSLLASQGVHASYFPGLFFAFLLIGIGAGASFLPLLTLGMSDAPARDAGLASGIVNVSVQLFGAIGLATLGTIATDHTKALSASGHALGSALTGGYDLAYIVAAVCVAVGILAAALLLRPPAASALQEANDPEPARGEHAGEPEPVAQAA